MHYTLLTAVSVPQFHTNKKDDDKVAAVLRELDMQLSYTPKGVKDEIRQTKRRQGAIRQFAKTFARDVGHAVWERMAPFALDAEPQYLEFHDETRGLISQYKNDGTDCILYPDGKIESLHSNHDIRVVNGKLILSCNSRKSEKDLLQLRLLQNYPNQKLYKSYSEMADDYGYSFDEDHAAYGYYLNPNTKWDWYFLGGSQPDWFLVKNTCREYVVAPTDEAVPCPEGYMWVCAARKKDIEWEIMRQWRTDCATAEFYKLKEIFESKAKPKDSHMRVTKRGIERSDQLLYWDGITKDVYLRMHNADPEVPYPDADSYLAAGEFSERKSNLEDWQQELAEFIESVSPCDVLVGIGYHI